MNATQLLRHFDRLAEAPDAVPRLRRFILDLAVRGKLVEQDAADEPATTLLKRIASSSEKKAKVTTAASLREPWPLPSNWAFARFAEILTREYGDNLPAEKRSNSGEFPAYGSNGIVGSHDEAFVQSPCIVVGRKGSAGALNLCLASGCCVTDVAYYCIPPQGVDLNFAFKMFHTIGLDALGKGIKPGLSRSEAYELVVPLPPLAEQHRIVAKVDELMAQCDQLEAAQQERERRRDRLASASLQRLNQPAEANPATDQAEAAEARQQAQREQQKDHARFHLQNLNHLVTRPEHIKAMRQTILHLAVNGRLLEQILNGEPKRTELRKGAKRTVRVDSPVFTQAFAPMTVPTNWEVIELEDLAAEIVDCPHSTPVWSESGKMCVRTSQFRPGFLDLTNVRFVSETTYTERIQRLVPSENDILYSREGGILGVACRVPAGVELCLGQRMMLIRAGAAVAPIFLELVLNSPLITEIARTRTTGGAAPRVNVATVKAYPIPLPPLAEQHSIVAKVDELMALCDQLEAQLTQSQTDSRRLLEAVLEAAIA